MVPIKEKIERGIELSNEEVEVYLEYMKSEEEDGNTL